jgi:malate dehydrogenase
MSNLVNVAVTGAGGQIGYALLFCLCSGKAFGPDTRVALRLLEIPPAMKALEGTVMELEDCTYPLLESVVMTDNPKEAFDGVNWALLVGARPRSKGMERRDLICVNVPIFEMQGQALAARAASDLRVLVVGNPANTNCLVAANNAPGVPQDRFAAMTFLDHNRARAQLAKKANVPITEVSNVTIWGNHSNTQYPDAENARISNQPAYEVINDHDWLRNDFVATVQQRGTVVIATRGHSSAGSAANAIADHIQSMINRTPEGHWFSAAVPSDGSYGVDVGLFCSFPLVSDGEANYSIVQDLPMSDWAKEKFKITLEELRAEKEFVANLTTLCD